MVKYNLEDIGADHPALLTGNFEACAIARCRDQGPSPYLLDTDCQQLFNCGTKSETCEAAWQPSSTADAEKAKKTYQPRRVTEDGAIGLCAATFAALGEGEITEVTAHGTGVDYWVDDRRAVLEISGIEKGAIGALQLLHDEKEKQVRQGSLFKVGYPGYVFVVDFNAKKAIFSYHK